MRVVTRTAGRGGARLGAADEAYVAAHHRGPALLHHVSPRIGLRHDDFAALADFAGSLGG